ncbi:hypothetical protein F0562_017993 [Nyssa sinensis]|uniref:O-fucosyltransferase family protein n=1 Tax=Nyssa sinensis TaxID=561372 RepID=A0A5J4ZAR4_9ASTE|nr:hypothetical protein F0562_017993 [Nyssa sinensis]
MSTFASQRTASHVHLLLKICDAVAVAKILNATLVILHLEVNPVWQDSSSFTEIFDVDHIINVQSDEVSIATSVDHTTASPRQAICRSRIIHHKQDS